MYYCTYLHSLSQVPPLLDLLVPADDKSINISWTSFTETKYYFYVVTYRFNSTDNCGVPHLDQGRTICCGYGT